MADIPQNGTETGSPERKRRPRAGDTFSDIAALSASAQKLTEDVSALSDSQSRAALTKAELAFLHGEFDQACAQFNALLAKAPYHPAVNLRLGEIYARQNKPDAAIKALLVALRYRPGDTRIHILLGQTLLQQNKAEEAHKHFLRALGENPQDFDAWMGSGHVLLSEGKMQQAMHSFARATTVRPGAADAWYFYGHAALTMNAPGKARDAFARAIAIRPNHARAHAGHAATLMMQGHHHDAEKEAAEAMADAPTDSEVFYNLSTIRDFLPDDPDLTRMAALAETDTLSEPEAMALHFALAKAFDDCCAYPRAFAHMQKANLLQHGMVHYDETAHLREMQQIQKTYNREMLARPQGNPSPRPVFLIGMPRTGATLLEQMLDSHPEIYGAGNLSDFGACAAGSYALPRAARPLLDAAMTGAAYLARTHTLAPKAARIIDKKPENFRFVGAIRMALPGARFIFLRRSPDDTALSCYRSRFFDQNLCCCDLGEIGRYFRAYQGLMAHWYAILPQSCYMEVTYEDLVRAPEACLRRILGFLDLKWDPACLQYFDNPRPVQSLSAANVRKPLYRNAIGKAAFYVKELAAFRRAFTPEN